ncbi:polysaccharide lyase 6 family protein [Actinomadura macrotermitis]|uniref:Lyase n=1 Tax=Actinomadura macrotermitis TaxID=2585200 RepID=A0A7K0C361_9ACTN|nr:polysaccharide lyase 6 family protein [Actinomadura macrotermitis]MQY07917.1 hypothetical protein [Actinomadura macrotermitis]
MNFLVKAGIGGAAVLAAGGTVAVMASADPVTARPVAAHRTVPVDSIAALQRAVDRAAAGDEIVLKAGSYRVDRPITVRGARDLTVRAAQVGKVTLTGTAGFELSGTDRVTLSGFVFRQSVPVEVPASAPRTRLTRNVFRLAEGPGKNNWVSVAADDVSVDHNAFQGKRSQGVYLQIFRDATAMPQRTRVYANLFADHRYAGANGGESIRLGYGAQAALVAKARIERNLFEHADGDAEALSVKSSGNTLRYNTFRSSKGWLVLRAGKNNSVYGNFLLGTSGIRVHDADNKVYGNYAGALTIGGFKSDHAPADRLVLAYNTIVGPVTSSYTGAPKGVLFADNLLKSAQVRLTTDGSWKWTANLIDSPSVSGVPAGYLKGDARLVRAGEIYRLTDRSPAIGRAVDATGVPAVTVDIDGQPRPARGKDVGADEFSTAAPIDTPLTAARVGPAAK